jgi:hypothetical protein
VFFPVLLVGFLWSVFSLVCLCDSQRVEKALLSMHVKINTLGVLVVSGVLLFLLYYTTSVEPYGCVLLKSVAFAVCAISWIYMVGIKHVNHDNTMISGMYITRFLPMLILPIWMAVIFFVAVVGCLVYLFRKRYQHKYSAIVTGNTGHVTDIPMESTGIINNNNATHGKKRMEGIMEESIAMTMYDNDIENDNDMDHNMEDLQRMFQLARQKNAV